MIRRRAAAAVVAGIFALVAASAVLPEWKIAREKRRLREGEGLLLDAARQREPAQRDAILRDAEEVLEGAAEGLPHDVRPSFLLGSAALLRGDAAAALDRYRRSLAIEERPETDMNLSRAYAAAGNAPAAAVDAVRAVWLAPDLAKSLVPPTREAVERHVRRRLGRFNAGKATVPQLWPESAIATR